MLNGLIDETIAPVQMFLSRDPAISTRLMSSRPAASVIRAWHGAVGSVPVSSGAGERKRSFCHCVTRRSWTR